MLLWKHALGECKQTCYVFSNWCFTSHGIFLSVPDLTSKRKLFDPLPHLCWFLQGSLHILIVKLSSVASSSFQVFYHLNSVEVNSIFPLISADNLDQLSLPLIAFNYFGHIWPFCLGTQTFCFYCLTVCLPPQNFGPVWRQQFLCSHFKNHVPLSKTTPYVMLFQRTAPWDYNQCSNVQERTAPCYSCLPIQEINQIFLWPIHVLETHMNNSFGYSVRPMDSQPFYSFCHPSRVALLAATYPYPTFRKLNLIMLLIFLYGQGTHYKQIYSILDLGDFFLTVAISWNVHVACKI
jgi:hypothetical protein